MATLKIIVDTDTGKATSEFKELNKELDKTGSESKNSALGVDDLVGAFKAFVGLSIVKELASTVYELGKLGIQVDAAESKFQAFAGGAKNADAILNAVRASTKGTVDDFTAMTSATRLMQMGIANTSTEIASIIELAVRLGDQTQTAGDRVADFSALLANQSIPRLDNFGISSAKVRARVEELTTGLNAMSREAAFTQAVLEEGAGSLDLVNSALTEAQLQSEQATAGFANLKNELGQGFAPAVAAVTEKGGGLLNWFAEAQRDTNTAIEQFGYLRGGFIGLLETLGATGTALDRYNEQIAEAEGYQQGLEASTSRLTALADSYASSQTTEAEAVSYNAQVTSEAEQTLNDYYNAITNQAVASSRAAEASYSLAAAQLETRSAYLESASALDQLSTQQFAQAQIQALSEAGVEGQAFVDAQQEILMHFGLLTEEEIKAQAGLDALIASYAAGEVSVETMGRQMEFWYQQAQVATTEADKTTTSINSLGDSAETKSVSVNSLADNVNLLGSDAKIATSEVAELSETVNTLEDKTVTVTFLIKTEGEVPDIPPGMASGGTVPRSGTYLVGEEGPELVQLPGNATVHNATTTSTMIKNYNLSVTSQQAASNIATDFRFMEAFG